MPISIWPSNKAYLNFYDFSLFVEVFFQLCIHYIIHVNTLFYMQVSGRFKSVKHCGAFNISTYNNIVIYLRQLSSQPPFEIFRKKHTPLSVTTHSSSPTSLHPYQDYQDPILNRVSSPTSLLANSFSALLMRSNRLNHILYCRKDASPASSQRIQSPQVMLHLPMPFQWKTPDPILRSTCSS